MTMQHGTAGALYQVQECRDFVLGFIIFNNLPIQGVQ
jgi:hypothetical protein